MKFRLNERQQGMARTAVWIFIVCLLIGVAAWRWSSVVDIFKNLISVLAPVITGLVIAYLFCPMQVWFEHKLEKLTDRKKPHPRLRRTLSVLLVIFVLLLAIIGLVAAIVPELITSIKNLFSSLPDYLTSVSDWINNHIARLEKDQPQLYTTLTSVWNSAQNAVNNFADQFEPKLDSIASGGAGILSSVTTGAVSVFTWIKNFLIGLFFAVYLLYNREHYQAQARKFLYAMFQEDHVHSFLRIASHVSDTFMHFLSGKTLDSLIIGLLCFIGMTILQMPYVTLISILIGVTNIIPFFGPIIGAVPSGVLILLSEPRKVIPFVIFILVLQQFDGNILGPKILGDTLGLPMFWILFAIIVGGGMFGFVGMVAFVPLFAAVYTLFTDFLNVRLQKKGLPYETTDYLTSRFHYSVSVPPDHVYEIVTPPVPEIPVPETPPPQKEPLPPDDDDSADSKDSTDSKDSAEQPAGDGDEGSLPDSPDTPPEEAPEKKGS